MLTRYEVKLYISSFSYLDTKNICSKNWNQNIGTQAYVLLFASKLCLQKNLDNYFDFQNLDVIFSAFRLDVK